LYHALKSQNIRVIIRIFYEIYLIKQEWTTQSGLTIPAFFIAQMLEQE
jgi:hypothetical protein